MAAALVAFCLDQLVYQHYPADGMTSKLRIQSIQSRSFLSTRANGFIIIHKP